MADPVRVVLVEDEPLFRDLVARALGLDPTIEVAGEFGSGRAALARVPGLDPDVALLDIELGAGENGVEVGLRLREHLPRLGIVLLSSHNDPSILTRLPSDQASGWSYLLKQTVRDLGTLVHAIRGAAEGRMTVDPSLTAARRPRLGSRLDRLSPRQREILQLLAEGLSNQAIADRLVLAQKSVENHINSLFSLLDLDSSDRSIQPRVQAARLYLSETSS